MPNPMTPTGPKGTTIQTLEDINGNTILEIKDEEYVVVEPDGSVSAYKNSTNFQLVDGFIFNMNMLNSKPPMYLAVCQECRNPSKSIFRREKPTHGIMLYARGKLCECGAMCCPKHRVLCDDNRWRCRKCAETYRYKSFFRSIFYKEIED